MGFSSGKLIKFIFNLLYILFLFLLLARLNHYIIYPYIPLQSLVSGKPWGYDPKQNRTDFKTSLNGGNPRSELTFWNNFRYLGIKRYIRDIHTRRSRCFIESSYQKANCLGNALVDGLFDSRNLEN